MLKCPHCSLALLDWPSHCPYCKQALPPQASNAFEVAPIDWDTPMAVLEAPPVPARAPSSGPRARKPEAPAPRRLRREPEPVVTRRPLPWGVFPAVGLLVLVWVAYPYLQALVTAHEGAEGTGQDLQQALATTMHLLPTFTPPATPPLPARQPLAALAGRFEAKLVSYHLPPGYTVHKPHALAVAPDGTVYFEDATGRALLAVDRAGQGRVAAGGAEEGRMDGPGAFARFRRITALACDGKGGVAIADRDNLCVRYMAPDGKVKTIMGTGYTGGPPFEKLQPADGGDPHGLHGLGFDADDDVYAYDVASNCIFACRPGARPGLVADLNGSSGSSVNLAVLPSGACYLVDYQKAQVWELGKDGHVTGRGLPKLKPFALAADGLGHLFLATDDGKSLSLLLEGGRSQQVGDVDLAERKLGLQPDGELSAIGASGSGQVYGITDSGRLWRFEPRSQSPGRP